MLRVLQLQLQILLLKKKLTVPNLPEPVYLMIHHGAGDWNFDQVNRSHKNRWGFRSSLGFYAGYHYFIEKSGKLYQARRDNERAAHCVEAGNPGYWNINALSICLQGNFEIEYPTKEQLKTLREWIDEKSSLYSIRRVVYHGEIVPTLCCGKNLIKILKAAKLNN